jgi:[ribosomal protein S5]-alanine N-acetyltransferase
MMLEAAKKVIEYTIGALNIQTIEAFTHKNNQPSIQLLGQLAFKKSMQIDKTDTDYLLFILSNKI